MKYVVLVCLLLHVSFPLPAASTTAEISTHSGIGTPLVTATITPDAFTVNVSESYSPTTEARGPRTDIFLNWSAPALYILPGENSNWFTVQNDTGLWNYDGSNITRFQLPNEITPFIVEEGGGELWFTDYDFGFDIQNTDSVVRYNPETKSGQIYNLPSKNTGPFDIVVRGTKVFFTQWLADKFAYLDTQTGSLTEVVIGDTSRTCGTVGLQEGPDGNIWIVETYCSTLTKINPSTLQYITYELPEDFYAPVMADFDTSGQLWTGAHAGNEILKFNPDDQSIRTIGTAPPSKESGAEFSGINDVEFDGEGRLWFTEHFLNYLGYMDEGVVYEFELPRKNPLIQWLSVWQNQVWWTEYSHGVISKLETQSLPKFEITTSINQIVLDRGSRGRVHVNVRYVGGLGEVIDVTPYARGEIDAVQGSVGGTYQIALGDSVEYDVDVSVTSNARIQDYFLVAGIEVEGYVITSQVIVSVQESSLNTVIIQGVLPVILIYTFGYVRTRRKHG